jgi:hypothetical protein
VAQNYPERIPYFRYFGEGYYCPGGLEGAIWFRVYQDMPFVELYQRENFKTAKAYPRIRNNRLIGWTRHDLEQYGDPQLEPTSAAREFLASLSQTPCKPCPKVRIHGLPAQRITVRCKP